MTIMFFKTRKLGLSFASHTQSVYVRRNLIDSLKKVKIENPDLLSHAGGRKYVTLSKVNYDFKKGETGYVFSWPGMRRDAGLVSA